MLDQRLDRREAGAAGNQQHRPFAVFARNKGAERPLDRAATHRLAARRTPRGESATGDMADMQLDRHRRCAVRWRSKTRGACRLASSTSRYCPGSRRSDRRAAAAGSAASTSAPSRRFSVRRTVICRRGISASELTSRAAIVRSLRGTPWHSRICPRACSAAFSARRRIARVVAIAGNQRRLATAADAGQARVRQRQPATPRRFEHGFAILDHEALAAGLQGDGMRHVSPRGRVRRRSPHGAGASDPMRSERLDCTGRSARRRTCYSRSPSIQASRSRHAHLEKHRRRRPHQLPSARTP